MTEQVIVTDDGPLRTIRMNRPEKKNALTSAMYDAMAEAIESASGASPIRCVLIAGAPGAFSAGNDLGDFNITQQGPFTGANAFGTNDTINFSIPGAGVHTIAPATTYPQFTKPVTINGYSQLTSSANTLATL